MRILFNCGSLQHTIHTLKRQSTKDFECSFISLFLSLLFMQSMKIWNSAHPVYVLAQAETESVLK